MLSSLLRPWLIGGWIATLAVILVISVAMGASLSTTVFLLALGLAPAIVMALVKGGGSSPTVAEILHTADSTDSRS